MVSPSVMELGEAILAVDAGDRAPRLSLQRDAGRGVDRAGVACDGHRDDPTAQAARGGSSSRRILAGSSVEYPLSTGGQWSIEWRMAFACGLGSVMDNSVPGWDVHHRPLGNVHRFGPAGPSPAPPWCSARVGRGRERACLSSRAGALAAGGGCWNDERPATAQPFDVEATRRKGDGRWSPPRCRVPALADRFADLSLRGSSGRRHSGKPRRRRPRSH